MSSAINPKNYFQGLPIPIAAGMVATFIIFNKTSAWPASKENFVLVLTFGLASLMVSTIRFPSMKEFNWRSRATFGYLMIGVLTMILIAVKPEVTLFLIGTCYISASLVWNIVRLVAGAGNPDKTKVDHGSSPSAYVKK